MKYRPMFDGREIRLTHIDLEKDSAAAAAWTEDLGIAYRLRSDPPLRPLATFEVRKIFDAWLKDLENSNRAYFFALRPYDDERLIGYLRIKEIMWLHGAAMFDLVIGQEADWSAYANDALSLGLQYAFDDLNLFRVSAWVAEYERTTCALYANAQFSLEVRQREAVFHEGSYWDRLQYGMLRPEWSMFVQQVGVPA